MAGFVTLTFRMLIRVVLTTGVRYARVKCVSPYILRFLIYTASLYTHIFVF